MDLCGKAVMYSKHKEADEDLRLAIWNFKGIQQGLCTQIKTFLLMFQNLANSSLELWPKKYFILAECNYPFPPFISVLALVQINGPLAQGTTI